MDFCFSYKGKIVGIEVKSGAANNLKSLFSFKQMVKNSDIVRVYNGYLKKEEIKIGGETVVLLSLPFYLIPRLLECNTGTS